MSHESVDERQRRLAEDADAEDARFLALSQREQEAEIRAFLYRKGLGTEDVEQWMRDTRPLHSV